MTLRDIQPGQDCVVRSIAAESALGQRLRDLGLLPGRIIRVLRNAPLKDPMELELEGYLISLRRGEAAAVGVEVCHE
ncbi:MAG: ferrous iron transport protein A [Deltaproteobacteria bacterium]|nr:ferrous iron transport protein A [Deltaproteobacteria bacterium]